MNRVLIVGEDAESAKALAFQLGLLGYEAFASAASPALALSSMATTGPDAIVLNSSADSYELFCLLEEDSHLPVVVLSSECSEADEIRYLSAGAATYIARPISPSALSTYLRAAMARDAVPIGQRCLTRHAAAERRRILVANDPSYSYGGRS